MCLTLALNGIERWTSHSVSLTPSKVPQYPLNWTFVEKVCVSNGIRIPDSLFRGLVTTEYAIVAAALLLLRTIRVLKCDVLVLASTGITVVGRFIVRMSTPSVTKIDELLSVSDWGVRERETYREWRSMTKEKMRRKFLEENPSA